MQKVGADFLSRSRLKPCGISLNTRPNGQVRALFSSGDPAIEKSDLVFPRGAPSASVRSPLRAWILRRRASFPFPRGRARAVDGGVTAAMSCSCRRVRCPKTPLGGRRRGLCFAHGYQDATNRSHESHLSRIVNHVIATALCLICSGLQTSDLTLFAQRYRP